MRKDDETHDTPAGEADIVPFPHPAAREGKRPPRRGPAGAKHKTAKPSRNLPGPPGRVGPEEDEETLLEVRVLRLAAFGMPVEEIEAICAEGLQAFGWDEGRVDAVVERGRCWGRARVMQAQFTAALDGKVSAQAHILARLEGEEEPEPGEQESQIAFMREVETERGREPEAPEVPKGELPEEDGGDE